MSDSTALENKVSASQLQRFVSGNGMLKGFDGLDNDDFTIPRMRLCQNTSRSGSPGKFFSVLNNELFDDLEVTVLNVSKSRSMWPEGQYHANDKPVCRSRDGRMKYDGIGAGMCKDCQYSKWTDRPPRCQEVFTFMCTTPDDFAFIILFKSTGVKYVKKYISILRNQGLPPFAVVTKITAKKEDNAKGVFYVPQFETVRRHELEEIERYARVLDQYMPYIPKDVDESEDYSASAASDTPATFNGNNSYMGEDHLVM